MPRHASVSIPAGPYQRHVYSEIVVLTVTFFSDAVYLYCVICFRYALYMLDNENLLDIWDLGTHPNLTIKNGIIFFHLNRKLCLYKIYNFRKAIGMDGRVDDADISPTNNGDQVTCKFHTSTVQFLGFIARL